MGNRTISTIIFDLGGVLVQLHDPKDLTRFLGAHGLRLNLFLDEYPRLMNDLGSGILSLAEVHEELVKKFGLESSFFEFQNAFDSLLIGAEVPGIHDVIIKLKRHFKVILLSNTNPSHVEYIGRTTRLFQPMDRLFLSHEMGLLKPDPRIFLELFHAMMVDPEETLFIDDIQENIEAAMKLGMNVIKADHNVSSGPLIYSKLKLKLR